MRALLAFTLAWDTESQYTDTMTVQPLVQLMLYKLPYPLGIFAVRRRKVSLSASLWGKSPSLAEVKPMRTLSQLRAQEWLFVLRVLKLMQIPVTSGARVRRSDMMAAINTHMCKITRTDFSKVCCCCMHAAVCCGGRADLCGRASGVLLYPLTVLRPRWRKGS